MANSPMAATMPKIDKIVGTKGEVPDMKAAALLSDEPSSSDEPDAVLLKRAVLFDSAELLDRASIQLAQTKSKNNFIAEP